MCVALGWEGIIIYYGYKELLESYCVTLTSVILSIEKEITFNTITKNLYDFFLFLYETGLNPADGSSGVSRFQTWGPK